MISRLLEVKNPSTNTDLLDADEELNKVEIGGEFSTSDPIITINDACTGSVDSGFMSMLSDKNYAGLYREGNSGEFALITECPIINNQVTLSSTGFAKLNTGNIYCPVVTLVGTNMTGSIGMNASGIQIISPSIGSGFLGIDSNGTLSTNNIPINDIPIPQYETLIGNSLNQATATSTLQVQGNKVGINYIQGTSLGANLAINGSLTGSSAFFTTITGTNIFTNNLNLVSGSAGSLTGSNAFFTSMSGNNIYGNTYTGTNMWVDSITGVSAHFSAYTGNKITATSILVAPNIQGGYASFNQAITGTTFNALTSVKSPLFSGSTHSGSNAYFTSITGSSTYLFTNIFRK